MEDKVELTKTQIEFMLRYIIKASQIFVKLEKQDYGKLDELSKDTLDVGYYSASEFFTFVKNLAKKIDIELPEGY